MSTKQGFNFSLARINRRMRTYTSSSLMMTRTN